MSKTAWLTGPAPESLAALRGAGQFVMRHREPSPTLTRSNWLLEIYVAGVLEIDVADTGWRRVWPRTAVLYAPGTRYRERSPHGQSSRSLCVFFDLGPDPLVAPLRQMAQPFAVLDDPHDMLAPRAAEVVQRVAEPGPGTLAAIAGLLQLLALLLGATRRADAWRLGDATDEEPNLLGQTRAFLRANLHRPLQVADLARHAGLTVSGFAHAYRRIAGCSPMQDLRHQRVEAVKLHLLRHRLPLDRIAQETGFADGFHLSHVFRQVTGISPRQFRQRSQSDLPEAKR